MNPEFGFGYPSPPSGPVGDISTLPPSASVSGIQNSNVLIVTKVPGGSHIPGPGSVPMGMGVGPMLQPSPGAATVMGWNIAQPQPMPNEMPTMPMTVPGPATSFPYASASSSLSQYSVRNQQNAEIAKIEPSVPPAQGYTLKGGAGEVILVFALEMTQSSNTPMVIMRSMTQMGPGTIIATLVTELKQQKEDKHKDKPKKDKKKEKDDHKDKDKSKGAKRQYILQNHAAQPLYRFSSKQKSKDVGKLELKIKSCADKDDAGGEVESLGSASGGSGFQIKFKSSHKNSSSHATGPDGGYKNFQKCLILASVIGILELFQSAQL